MEHTTRYHHRADEPVRMGPDWRRDGSWVSIEGESEEVCSRLDLVAERYETCDESDISDYCVGEPTP